MLEASNYYKHLQMLAKTSLKKKTKDPMCLIEMNLRNMPKEQGDYFQLELQFKFYVLFILNLGSELLFPLFPFRQIVLCEKLLIQWKETQL